KAIRRNTSALEKLKGGTPIDVPESPQEPETPQQPQPSAVEDRMLRGRKNVDPSLPNLLKVDPFYAVTFPKMLGPSFRPWGTQHDATIGRPDNLHPFSNWREVSNWQGLCLASLATMQFGKYETMAPDMALKMEAR